MLRDIKILTALELRNLWGLNTLRHTTDKSRRRRAMLLSAAWVILALMVFFYVGGLVYGLTLLGLEKIVGAYLCLIASALIFVFGIFKDGAVLFSRHGYDTLASLPVTTRAVTAARLIRLYVEDLLLTLAVLLPGGVVYAVLVRPGALTVLAWIPAALFLPLLPLAAASLVGTGVTALSSRMKHRSLVETGLMLLFVVGVMGLSFTASSEAPTLTPEMLTDLAGTVLELLGGLYPPALWLGTAMTGGSILSLALAAAVSLSAFGLVWFLASALFHRVCRALGVTSAKHDYRLGAQRSGSVLSALVKREFKRYFASSVYVTNTIVGPVMGLMLAGALAFVDPSVIFAELGMELDLALYAPFLFTLVMAMMPPVSVSLSMEGKQFWIAKSLPLSTGMILTAKLLMDLLLTLPFVLVGVGLMAFGLRPAGLQLLWMILLPLLLVVFSRVAALWCNLRFPRLDWDSEAYVVKQSAAAGLGGFGGVLVTGVCLLPVVFLPGYRDVVLGAECLLLLLASLLLHRKNCAEDLRRI